MPRNLFSLGQTFTRKVMALGLMLLLVLSGLFVVADPSFAVTSSRDKLKSEDKIDRAYQYRVGTGVLEEEKQDSPSANQIFKPEDKANLKSVKESQATDSEKSLVEQGKELLEKVTGNK
ncbi:hypothetical protein [Aliterella atlantica]|uniref:Uncharacterized protein n=1 Tax=Aliterella atlantica CENA595 TaxID=1618023 RepID=A0A0D8ZW47_9CYAN|nr:hypothetical protein [Aliterella atlantica]KJH72998.1 hypothetical protein UH38_02675 [Aliterella atlantica CENA595]